MKDAYWDARIEIAKAFIHAWVDAKDRWYFPKDSEEWLVRSGFYCNICIIPYPPHERWRRMMGMPPVKVVDRFFDDRNYLSS